MPACPSDSELVEFVEQLLDEPRRAAIEVHCDRCPRCLDAVSFLAKAFDSATPAAPAQPPDQRLGRYVLLDFIGAGAMGSVYTAYDPELDRRIAIKILSPSHGDADEHWRARFLTEARAMASISHPNVIPVHDVGTAGSYAFFAMERVEGQTLAEWMSSVRATDEIVEVFAAAGDGLAAAHAGGLVHRDFKPTNVLVGEDGRVRVIDFGLARFETPAQARPPQLETADESISAALTSPGTLVGTPAYMAPEQLAGGAADARADQFAFCVSLFEALHGRRPFDAPTLAARAQAIIDGPPSQSPGDRRIPRRLQQVLSRGLSPDPGARFASMEALVDGLRPGKSRRVWVASVGAVSLGALALAATTSPPETDPCPSTKALAELHWSDTRVQSVDRALSEGHTRLGPRAWSWIQPQLDQKISRWAEAEHRSCTARRGALGAQPTDARGLCRARWSSTFDHTVEVLAGAELDNPRDAMDLVARLADPDTCRLRSSEADSPLLSGTQTSEDHDAIMAYLDVLDRANVLRQASSSQQAIEMLEPQLQVAIDNGWLGAVAETYMILGTAQMVLDREDEAVANLRNAVVAAVKSNHAYAEASARLALVSALGERQGEVELARVEEQYARAVVERLGDPVLEAEHDMALASLLWREGEPAEAATHVERALEGFTDTLGEDDYRRLRAASYLGSLLRRVDPARAEQAIRGALEQLDARLDPGHPHRLSMLTDLADSVSKQGRSDEALALMREVVEVLEGEDPRMLRPYLLMVAHYRLAEALVAQGDNPGGLEEMRAAHAVAAEHFSEENPNRQSIEIALGAYALLVRASEGPSPDGEWLAIAEAHLVPGIERLTQRLGADHPQAISPLYNLAELRTLQGRADEARALYERSIRYHRDYTGDGLGVHDAAIQSHIGLANLDWEDAPDQASAHASEAWRLIPELVDPEMQDERRRTLIEWFCERTLLIPDGTTGCPDLG